MIPVHLTRSFVMRSATLACQGLGLQSRLSDVGTNSYPVVSHDEETRYDITRLIKILSFLLRLSLKLWKVKYLRKSLGETGFLHQKHKILAACSCEPGRPFQPNFSCIVTIPFSYTYTTLNKFGVKLEKLCSLKVLSWPKTVILHTNWHSNGYDPLWRLLAWPHRVNWGDNWC